MVRKPQVSVIGYNAEVCTDAAYKAAYEVGAYLARRGAVLINGGLKGVMEAASKGAADAGGLVVGIIPSDDASHANEYCDVVIPSGLGYARNFLVVNSSDAVIVVGGGAGTLTEAAAAYLRGLPIVAVKGTGGVADEWTGRFFDDRRIVQVSGADSAEDAVTEALMGASGRSSAKSRPR